MEPAAGNAPASSALQKRRDSLSIHAGDRNGGSRRACSPCAFGRTIRFRNSPGTLVRFSFQLKWWVATVPPRALRFKRPLHRCNACDPKGGSQWSCSTTSRSRSVRLPTGGGTLVRFNFQEKWSLRLDSHQHLTAYETAALLYATERTIRQPDLHRPRAVTNGERRYLRLGGMKMDAHPGLAPGNSVLQTDGSTALPCARFC